MRLKNDSLYYFIFFLDFSEISRRLAWIWKAASKEDRSVSFCYFHLRIIIPYKEILLLRIKFVELWQFKQNSQLPPFYSPFGHY